MKKRLIQIIKSIYYKLGFFPPQRILSAQQIKRDFKYLPEELKRFQIRNHTYKLAALNGINEYDAILDVYIPNREFKLNNSEFIIESNHGQGGSSFLTFRKGNFRNLNLFEKIYFSDHPDLQRNIFFDNHIYSLLKKDLQIPKLQKLISGEWLSIVYFDFFKLQKIEKTEDLIQEMIAVSLILYQKSKKYQEEISQLSPPVFIQDFTTHFEYQIHRKSAEKELLRNNISIDEIEEEINQSFKVLTHGDIVHTNIFQNKILIDWDNFGIYPIGFDVAFIYYRLLRYNQIDNDFEKWLLINYKNKIDSIHWKVFKRNSFFFLYIFINNKPANNLMLLLSNKLKNEIINHNSSL